MNYSLEDWLDLGKDEICRISGERVVTVVLYLNATRRWFQSQRQDWRLYWSIAGAAHREVSQLCYSYGINTLIQPFIGYDLLSRGQDYFDTTMKYLESLADEDYFSWFVKNQIRVYFYGNWRGAMQERGYVATAARLSEVMEETQGFSTHRLFIGLFADEGMDRIARLSQGVDDGQQLLRLYYGADMGAVDLIIGSGQPAIWDIPMLDINKANLYFLQAPTFCLTDEGLRKILYDHLFERRNDDEIQEILDPRSWENCAILGLGKNTRRGWVAS
ncbi:hypothetical protein H7H78_08745 [Mycobacterium shinjukuense]|uniref:Diterpene synthase n=1 Tax=Mycobacterium shinjukuense TaxID=398694 RepID=A0A7I7MN25_9MYCO|nr:hypothetical protein [Mycobacterium shinjukuense]MCV6985516.1 hypothetical protein [Mycobacterium shinjukuense]ORB66571.1 hypothetical protein BST45_13515 [Mycobacterium shinjukuense]BBX72709.1 diterpene synthase [Mycobacterium shinjukuense]